LSNRLSACSTPHIRQVTLRDLDDTRTGIFVSQITAGILFDCVSYFIAAPT
jgi:hypothetical protein